jgi:putative transcriptional regulator
MKEEAIIRARMLPSGKVVQVLPDGLTRPLKDRTDKKRLRTMTEEEAEANARQDSDNPPMTEEELAEFEPVPDPREIRKSLHMTQRQFASTFRFSLGAVRDWEQGRKIPDPSTRTLLKVIAHRPEAVQEALGIHRER